MRLSRWLRDAAGAQRPTKHGPTAVFKSISKLPTDKITGGVLLNQKMTPQMLSTAENRQKLEMLIRTFFNTLHGYHVQYNIVSRDTLIDAQLHPEDHKDLIVRVAGYSAFFNVLSKKRRMTSLSAPSRRSGKQHDHKSPGRFKMNRRGFLAV